METSKWIELRKHNDKFYVKITPDAANSHGDPNEVAHKIARRNGFHNLGPVRPFFVIWLSF